MNCWQCKTELIWGGDHTGEDYGNEDYEIVSNLSCPKCDAFVLVYHQKKKGYRCRREVNQDRTTNLNSIKTLIVSLINQKERKKWQSNCY